MRAGNASGTDTLMELIDIGLNLTSERFRKDREAIVQHALEAGVRRMIITGTNVQESRRALKLADKHPDVLYATAGVHPHVAKDVPEDWLQQLRALQAEKQVVAAGETGLDFNRDFSPRPVQERAFEQQLELACETGLPVFIHQRDAHERLLPIIRAFRDHLADAVVHCFTDSRQSLWDYLDLDLYIGITGWVCDERRGRDLQALVPEIPANRLMLETDAPYLMPRDLEPKPEHNRNEPRFLPHILQAVARLRGDSPDTLAGITTANAERFFRLPPAG